MAWNICLGRSPWPASHEPMCGCICFWFGGYGNIWLGRSPWPASHEPTPSWNCACVHVGVSCVYLLQCADLKHWSIPPLEVARPLQRTSVPNNTAKKQNPAACGSPAVDSTSVYIIIQSFTVINLQFIISKGYGDVSTTVQANSHIERIQHLVCISLGACYVILNAELNNECPSTRVCWGLSLVCPLQR